MSTPDNQSQSDGPADPPPGNGAPGAEHPGIRTRSGPPREDEVSHTESIRYTSSLSWITCRPIS